MVPPLSMCVWRMPAIALLLASAGLGHYVRTPQLVASAGGLDAAALSLICGAASPPSAGSPDVRKVRA